MGMAVGEEKECGMLFFRTQPNAVIFGTIVSFVVPVKWVETWFSGLIVESFDRVFSFSNRQVSRQPGNLEIRSGFIFTQQFYGKLWIIHIPVIWCYNDNNWRVQIF